MGAFLFSRVGEGGLIVAFKLCRGISLMSQVNRISSDGLR